jgi:hypothetical protein
MTVETTSSSDGTDNDRLNARTGVLSPFPHCTGRHSGGPSVKETPIGYTFYDANIREVFRNNGGGISIRGEDGMNDEIIISMTFDQARELAVRLKSLARNRRSSSIISPKE